MLLQQQSKSPDAKPRQWVVSRIRFWALANVDESETRNFWKLADESLSRKTWEIRHKFPETVQKNLRRLRLAGWFDVNSSNTLNNLKQVFSHALSVSMQFSTLQNFALASEPESSILFAAEPYRSPEKHPYLIPYLVIPLSILEQENPFGDQQQLMDESIKVLSVASSFPSLRLPVAGNPYTFESLQEHAKSDSRNSIPTATTPASDPTPVSGFPVPSSQIESSKSEIPTPGMQQTTSGFEPGKATPGSKIPQSGSGPRHSFESSICCPTPGTQKTPSEPSKATPRIPRLTGPSKATPGTSTRIHGSKLIGSCKSRIPTLGTLKTPSKPNKPTPGSRIPIPGRGRGSLTELFKSKIPTPDGIQKTPFQSKVKASNLPTPNTPTTPVVVPALNSCISSPSTLKTVVNPNPVTTDPTPLRSILKTSPEYIPTDTTKKKVSFGPFPGKIPTKTTTTAAAVSKPPPKQAVPAKPTYQRTAAPKKTPNQNAEQVPKKPIAAPKKTGGTPLKAENLQGTTDERKPAAEKRLKIGTSRHINRPLQGTALTAKKTPTTTTTTWQDDDVPAHAPTVANYEKNPQFISPKSE